jgi:hypothetical protein
MLVEELGLLPEITRFRMLVVGGQLPFHDGFDIGPRGARKWVQRGHTGARDALHLLTVVGECKPLPPDEWDRFAHGIKISGIVELEGNPYYPGFHYPTWYFDVELGDSHKRFKAYGASGMEVLTGEDWEDLGVWSAGLAISEVDYFELRVPWRERLEKRGVRDYAEPLADLQSISGDWNPGRLEPMVEAPLRRRLLGNDFAVRLTRDAVVDRELWTDLVAALELVAEPWQHATTVDKELVNYLVSVLGALDQGKDSADRQGSVDLAADIAGRRTEFYSLVQALLDKKPSPI